MNRLNWLGLGIVLASLQSCGGDNVGHTPGPDRLDQLSRAAAPELATRSKLPSGSASLNRLAAAGTPPITSHMFLDWAERSYEDFFRPPAQAITLNGWVVRFYPATSLYLGVRDDGKVYALGPVTNNEVVALGQLADYTCRVNPPSCIPPDPVGVGSVIGISGIAAWDALPADQKARVNTTMRSFFLHQSVGGDLEDGAQAVGFKFEYADSGAVNLPAGLNGGLFASSNGNYSGKIAEFRDMAIANRSSLGVAIMKFGYADILVGTLANAQAEYLAAVNTIKAQGVRVLHVTPPLVYNVPAENAPKMQMRSWMIATFPLDVIVDLEDLASTDPSTAARCERGGFWEICDAVRSTAACPSLNQGVDASSGQGHLCFNPHAQRLAKAFLYAIYRAQL